MKYWHQSKGTWEDIPGVTSVEFTVTVEESTMSMDYWMSGPFEKSTTLYRIRLTSDGEASLVPNKGYGELVSVTTGEGPGEWVAEFNVPSLADPSRTDTTVNPEWAAAKLEPMIKKRQWSVPNLERKGRMYVVDADGSTRSWDSNRAGSATLQTGREGMSVAVHAYSYFPLDKSAILALAAERSDLISDKIRTARDVAKKEEAEKREEPQWWRYDREDRSWSPAPDGVAGLLVTDALVRVWGTTRSRERVREEVTSYFDTMKKGDVGKMKAT